MATADAHATRGPRAFRVPHTLVLLFGIMVAAWLATWILPQGAYETVQNEAGRSVVVPGTYTVADERVTLAPWDLFTAVPRAMADAQGIIFFLLIVGGAIAVLRATGTIDALLGWVLRRVGHSPGLLIAVGTTVFAIGSATLGASTEYIPFAAVLVALCMAMRLDAMTAIGIMVGGYCIGYGVAIMNPYTVVVAQSIAEVPPMSGLWLRLAIFIPFVAVGVHHTWAYARRVRADPSASLMAGLAEAQPAPAAEYPPLNGRRLTIAAVTALGLAAMVYGIPVLNWYLVELGAIWLGVAVAAGVISGIGVDETAKRFAAGASELAVVALLVGFARSIALLLEDGRVLHTIVHGLSVPLQQVAPAFAAVGMLGMQTLMNFFIPSGSGQAYRHHAHHGAAGGRGGRDAAGVGARLPVRRRVLEHDPADEHHPDGHPGRRRHPVRPMAAVLRAAAAEAAGAGGGDAGGGGAGGVQLRA
jgi:uncharacterized ion transporter superfamily protein YfcC